MQDFLTFQSFISPGVLLAAYYVGALVMPVLLWLGRNRLVRRFAVLGWLDQQRQQVFQQLSSRDQWLVALAVVLLFIFMEIVWRMMFEAMIGYFQMHDFLRQLAAAGA